MLARLAIVGFIAALAAIGLAYAGHEPAKPQPGATVKLLVGQGHGSAVHLGGGVFLTAAHVVDGEATLRVKMDNGQIVSASKLWSSPEYDIAMVIASSADHAKTAPLSCRTPPIGEELEARGNPSQIEFARIRGRVAGGAQEYGPWRQAFTADMSIAPGMSGGPVLDRAGNIVGVSVGVAVFFQGLFPLGYIVPASTVCMLTGRVA